MQETRWTIGIETLRADPPGAILAAGRSTKTSLRRLHYGDDRAQTRETNPVRLAAKSAVPGAIATGVVRDGSHYLVRPKKPVGTDRLHATKTARDVGVPTGSGERVES